MFRSFIHSDQLIIPKSMDMRDQIETRATSHDAAVRSSSTSTEDAKSREKHIEDVKGEGETGLHDDSHLESGAEWDEASVQRLIRKIDWRLIPFLALLYLLSFLDRTNIGNARLDTLEADLDMSGLQYNHALAIFFPFYVAAEVPSNMAMKRFKPSIWIPIIMLAWYVDKINLCLDAGQLCQGNKHESRRG